MPIGVPQRERLVHHVIRGAMAAADLMIWPVATATGFGQAVLSRWGPLRQPATGRVRGQCRPGPPAVGDARPGGASGTTRRG